MKNISVRKITILENTSIKDAVRRIDRLGLRTIYVVNKNKKLLGIITDSEIRKAILKGIDIKEPVFKIVNPQPICLTEKELENNGIVGKTIKELLRKMPDANHILVTDENSIPKKILCIDGFLGITERTKKKRIIKSILIVGGAGYLGSVLVEKLLLRNYKVKVLDLFLFGLNYPEHILKHKNFRLIKGDIRNISTIVDNLQKIDVVINLAAIVGDPASKNQPETTIETNYLANKALAEACKYFQVNRFIFASTCSVYGYAKDNEELSEDSLLNPLSLYARSKIKSEEAVLSLEDDNFSPTILRMGTLYGYSSRMRFDLVVNAMVKSAFFDKKIFVHGGNQYRPLLNVNDAAQAYIKCLEAPIDKIKGQIFNVGSSEQNYRVIEIAEIVKKSIPKASIIIDESLNDARDYIVSFNKINKDLKFKAKFNLADSIKEIIKAIENGKIKDVNDIKHYNSRA